MNISPITNLSLNCRKPVKNLSFKAKAEPNYKDTSINPQRTKETTLSQEELDLALTTIGEKLANLSLYSPYSYRNVLTKQDMNKIAEEMARKIKLSLIELDW